MDDIHGQVLEKNPKRRWQAIGDLRIELERLATGPAISAVMPVRILKPAPLWRRAIPFVSTALVAGAAMAALAWNLKPAAESRVTKFFVTPPDKSIFQSLGRVGAHAAISPDGRKLAFTIRNADNKVALWVRPIDALVAQPLPSTDGAAFPFWSPDSRFIAYFAQGKLHKIDASGGPPQSLCDSGTPAQGGAWSPEGVILFAPTRGAPLMRVSAAGGQPTPATGYFDTGPHNSGNFHTYAVSRNGQRFLIPRRADSTIDAPIDPVVVVLNWTATLKN